MPPQASLMHAPWNLDLDQPGAMDRLAPRIYRQVVMLRAMPVSNATHITEDERAMIARWYRSLPPAAPAKTNGRTDRRWPGAVAQEVGDLRAGVDPAQDAASVSARDQVGNGQRALVVLRAFERLPAGFPAGSPA